MKKWRVLINFLSIFPLLGCLPTKQRPFPKELMHWGVPIHPAQIVATQFGDSSHLEPQSVEYHPYYEELNFKVQRYQLSFDFTENTVESTVKYTVPYIPDCCSYDNYDAYSYLGTYQGKHLVLCSFYDSSGTGRFSSLGFVERIGDKIVNAGDIAFGDRGHGGVITVDTLQGNTLRYTQAVPPDEVIYELCGQDLKQGFPPFSYGICLVRKVALDDPHLRSQVDGVRFDWTDTEEFIAMEDDRYTPEDCFFKVVKKYCKSGKSELTLEEGRIFAEEVMQLVNQVKRNGLTVLKN